VLAEGTGEVGIEVPWDRESFETGSLAPPPLGWIASLVILSFLVVSLLAVSRTNALRRGDGRVHRTAARA